MRFDDMAAAIVGCGRDGDAGHGYRGSAGVEDEVYLESIEGAEGGEGADDGVLISKR